MTGAIIHCRYLVNFRIAQNDRLYYVKALDAFMDHEPVKISICIIDVLFSRFKWRASHDTPALDDFVTENVNEALEKLMGPLPRVGFHTSLTTKLCGICDEFCNFHWDEFSDKSKCFDYGELATTREIEDNFGIDVGLIPTLIIDNIPMRD
jgi:hypothetical protein